MALHELLPEKRSEIIERWAAEVRRNVACEGLAFPELVDHMPAFLDEVVQALRHRAGARTGEMRATTSAPGHGEQRLRLGFSVDAVVREYGELRAVIIDVATEVGAPPAVREMQVVVDCIISGIAHAVSEYARQRDAEMLRQANEHFAFVAHELRNPLGAAMTAFDLLRRTGKLSPDDLMVGAVDRGLRHVRELVDETLRAARFASGLELHREWVMLGDLAAELELGGRPEAHARGVEVVTTVSRDERVFLDRRLVRSAVGNLLQNGIKYTPAGGTVELRARVAGDRVLFEVEDRCGGLPPGGVERAFAPFVRLSRGPDGFGLGLSIARQAADAHGGTLRAEDLPGRGCVFALELPAFDGAEGA